MTTPDRAEGLLTRWKLWVVAGVLLVVGAWWLAGSSNPHPPAPPPRTGPPPRVLPPAEPAPPSAKELKRIQDLAAALDQLSRLVDRAEFNFRTMPQTARYPEEAENFHRWADEWKEEVDRFPRPPEPDPDDGENLRRAYREFERVLEEVARLKRLGGGNVYGFPGENEREVRILGVRRALESAKRALELARRNP